MKKMGESQIIQFFSNALSDEIGVALGRECKFAIGNFSGSQDRKFADFFAGTDSVNVLIEFKEFKNEYQDEIDKPLREKLCQTLSIDIARLSRICHFIGWGANSSALSIELNPYIDLVCQLWEDSSHLECPADYMHSSFIDAFVKGTVGAKYEDFVLYIEHLNKTAGGTAAGVDAPFRSILFSRDNNGRLVGNRFENLRELNALRNLVPSRSHGHGFSSGRGGR